MSLQADLSLRLDASGSLAGLSASGSLAISEMDAVSLPDLSADFAAGLDLAGRVDFSSLDGLVAQLGRELEPLVAELPLPADALVAVRSTVDIASQLSALNLPDELANLAADIDAQLGSSGDFLGQVQAVVDLLAGHPGLANARDLLVALAGLTGGKLQADDFSLPDLLPSLLGGFNTVRALMGLHTQLSEAQRLAGVVLVQLDAEGIALGVAQVERQLGLDEATSLQALVAALDVANPTAVAVARRALEDACGAVQALGRSVAEGMAFGEATLVHLDAPGLRASVGRATVELDGIDLAPLARLLAGLEQRLGGVLPDLDAVTAPASTLEEWLQLAESQVADIAARIDGTDVQALFDPLQQGIDSVLALPNELTRALAAVQLAVADALQGVQRAVQAVPLATITDAINRVLAPVNEALEFLTGLVADIQAAVETAVAALNSALGTAEEAVDTLISTLDALFADAEAFLAQLDIEAVVGNVSDSIRSFSEALAAADMSPYFDTVVDAIETTADVVDKVPFDLLPDSMEQEVVDAVRPIKQTNVDAVQLDIQNLLQIGPDGKFALRPELENALAGVQQKFDDLLAAVRAQDPRLLTAALDAELDRLAERIGTLVPTVALAPLEDALATLRETVAAADLDAQMQPLRDTFDQVLAGIDGFDPGALLAPLETELASARDGVFDSLQIDTWVATLNDLRSQTLALVDPLDPAQLEPQLAAVLAELQAQADNLPRLDLGFMLGSLFTAAGGGGGARAPAFGALLDWLEGASGTTALAGLASAAASAVDGARDRVQQVDPAALVLRLGGPLNAVRSAVNNLPDGPVRTELLGCAGQLDINAALQGFAGLRRDYLNELQQASTSLTELAHTGLSQVDVSVGGLRTALAPLDSLAGFGRSLLGTLGVSGSELGIAEVVRQLLAVTDAQRLAGIAEPVLTALKGRLAALLDGLLDPLLSGIGQLAALKDALTLAPVTADLAAIQGAVRGQVASLHPDVLLGDSLAAFAATQAQVAAFDPLGPIAGALDNLRDTSARVLGKLDSDTILARPLAVYDGLLGTLSQLDLAILLAPVLSTLDDLSGKVEQGLGDTTSAFRQLQAALPDRVGSTSVSLSVSVSA